MLPGPVSPDDVVPMEPDALGLAEVNDLVGRRSAPVGLHLRVLAVVPKLLGIPVLRDETGTTRFHLGRFPVAELNRVP